MEGTLCAEESVEVEEKGDLDLKALPLSESDPSLALSFLPRTDIAKGRTTKERREGKGADQEELTCCGSYLEAKLLPVNHSPYISAQPPRTPTPTFASAPLPVHPSNSIPFRLVFYF